MNTLLALLVFGAAAVALALTHVWGLKRRAAGMKQFAEEHNMMFTDWTPTPSSFPHIEHELRNAVSGEFQGQRVFIVDEHVSAGRSSHIRTVVGFKTDSNVYREWYDGFRLWQVYPGDGSVWVHRRMSWISEKRLAGFVLKAWEKAKTRLS